jgi:single-strand DNA-binding protein
MFNDVNEVRLLGNVTQDPKLNFTPSGTAVLAFGMATNRRYKHGEEWKDDTTFHNIVVWGALAQRLEKRLKKGTRLYLSGRVTVQMWESDNGKKNYKTEIVAEDISLISRYNEVQEQRTFAEPPKENLYNQAQPNPQTLVPAEGSPEDSSIIDPDELPF